jgi:sec-independent protein translocase protein TatB
MGSEFQRELNKTTGLDQITDLRRSITEPLKQTAAEITREFNKVSSDAGGKVEPTGIVAPKDPAAESVVAEIHERVGMTPAEPGPIAAPVMTGPKPVESPAPVEAIAPVETAAPKPVRKPRAKKAAAAPAQPPAAVAETPAPAKKPAAPRKRRTPKPTTEA